MKFSNKALVTIAIAIALCGGKSVFAIDVVTDPGHMQATIGGWAAQATDMGNQLSQLKQQYDQLQTTYKSLTGSRGTSDLLNSPVYQQARRMLPPNAQQVLGLANGGGYRNLGDTINSIKQATTTLNNDSFSSPTAANQWQANINRAATNKALSMEAYGAAAQRLQNLEDLTAQISQTQDPKSIAELQARINAEQGIIQNEQAKIQALSMLAAAEQKIAEQQAREVSIKMAGSVASVPRIHVAP